MIAVPTATETARLFLPSPAEGPSVYWDKLVYPSPPLLRDPVSNTTVTRRHMLHTGSLQPTRQKNANGPLQKMALP